jgi:hypothetical protein
MRDALLGALLLGLLAGGVLAAPPKGCECIGKERAKALIQKSTKKNLAQVGEDFGSYCAAWEDGACRTESCHSAESLSAAPSPTGPGHTCGTEKECTALWGGEYNFDVDQVRGAPAAARCAGPVRAGVCVR